MQKNKVEKLAHKRMLNALENLKDAENEVLVHDRMGSVYQGETLFHSIKILILPLVFVKMISG